MKFSTKDCTLIGLFAALTAILSQLSIPIGEVPITLQTFAVMLPVYILGKKNGMFAQIVFILIGAVGIPVFANFRGGLNVLVGPTGGYLISFPIIAFVTGYLIEKRKTPSKPYLFLCGIIGLIICYAMGTVQLAFVLNLSFKKALYIGVIPFVIFDLIKIALAVIVGSSIKQKLKYVH